MKNAFTVDWGDFGNIGGPKGAQEAFEGGSEQAGRQAGLRRTGAQSYNPSQAWGHSCNPCLGG